jgi:hypothetical protein
MKACVRLILKSVCVSAVQYPLWVTMASKKKQRLVLKYKFTINL